MLLPARAEAEEEAAMWKWIKIPKIGALVAFFMPWLTVSCSGMSVASATGWQLAFGGYSHAASEAASKAPSSGGGNLWLLLAILVIVGGIWIAFLQQSKRRSRNLALSSAAALLLIWLGTARYSTSALMAEAARNADNGFSGTIDQATLAMIQFKWEFGYWLTVLSLIAATVMATIIHLEEKAASASGEAQARSAAGVG